MWSIEVVIRLDAAMPFRVSEVRTEARVKEIIESFLAAWGRPTPDSLRDTEQSLFTERLARAGGYRSDTPEHLIIVKPGP